MAYHRTPAKALPATQNASQKFSGDDADADDDDDDDDERMCFNVA